MQPILERGDLVPDELMVDLIRERLADEDGFVLDGFPRTVPQAEALDAMLDEIGKPLDVVLLLQVSDDVAIERLLGRRAAEGRADDAPEAIRNRLRLYHELTEPVVERYRAEGHARGRRRRAAGRRRRAARSRTPSRRWERRSVIIRKSPREIEKIARPATLVAETIAHVGALLAPGVTTGELDAPAGAFIREHGGIPTSRGLQGLPERDLHLTERGRRARHPGGVRGRRGRPRHDRRRA